MKHIIKDDIYYLYNDTGDELMTIKLDNSISGDQVVITTPYEVYAGPVKFIRFSKDITTK